jgi:hypothetical protein
MNTMSADPQSGELIEYELSDVNNDGKELIQAVGIICIVDCIEQPQFKGKCNTICQLDVFLEVVLVLEAF